jgi:cytochrome c biogenesis protein CcmG, thiol:disulfide interchange protein DsbE
MNKRYLIPLGVFVVVAGFLFVGLGLNPREVPSPLVNKPAPAFVLPRLDSPAVQVAAEQMKGQVWVLNVFASWCTPCLAEHPLVTQLSRQPGLQVIGLNYKDRGDDARTWLARHGNPYAAVVVDADGRVAIDYGVYGVPETFVIDRAGLIRFKHTGPLTPDVMRDQLLPLLKKLHG